MSEDFEPSKMSRDFKGIWIPREIWLRKDLSVQEKALWAEIDSLYCEEVGGCYAENPYLMQFMGVKERQLQNMLASLKEKGLIVQISFDGRRRVLKAVCVAEVQKIAPQKGNKLHPHIYREQRIEKRTTTPEARLPAGGVVVSSSLQKKIRELPGMTDKLFKKAISSSSEEELQNAYDFAMAPNVIKRIAVFQSALTGKWKKNVEKVNPKQLAMTLFEDDKTYNGAKCQLSPSCIVFYSGSKSDGVSFDDPQFLVKFRKILDSFGIKREF